MICSSVPGFLQAYNTVKDNYNKDRVLLLLILIQSYQDKK